MIYLTLGEGWSGVLSSQVVDACRYLETAGARSARLVCFASLRHFVRERARFREARPGAIVVPMAPRLANWRANRHLLSLVVRRTGERRVVGRGALACQLALEMRDAGLVDAVGFDGRGAQAAEWHEYDMVDGRLRDEIADLEAGAVARSDARLAVSHALVQHWRDAFGYRGDRHVVVPCTIGASFDRDLPDEASRQATRARLGFAERDVVLVFAGMAAGWQSFGLLDTFLRVALASDARARVLILADADGAALPVAREHPDRVRIGWVPHAQMFETLAACDHGLLLRERSVTNRVAAPTKLAEYLAAGLDVVVSPEVGDYSAFVAREGCGIVVGNDDAMVALPPPSRERRQRNHELALRHFTKRAHATAYRRFLADLGEPSIEDASGGAA